jgi:hypothetical protein
MDHEQVPIDEISRSARGRASSLSGSKTLIQVTPRCACTHEGAAEDLLGHSGRGAKVPLGSWRTGKTLL